MLLGSHVGMSGKAMLLGSAKEAVSYGANTFMFYTGAPQNTRRKDISELNIDTAWEYMHAQGIEQIVVHAPYIINLGNSVKPETFELAVNFLRTEIERTRACKSHVLILHPGAHVGAGTDVGISQIIKGLNEVLTPDMDLQIALETMAGKGSEIVEKVVKSAAANAENNHEMNPDALYVAEISANKGPTMKRFQPGSQGRASIILKRTSHVGVTLKER